MYWNYNGTGMQMGLFFASLLYLAVQKKGKEKNHLFLGYSLLFLLLFFCPVTAKVIMEKCIGKEVYWRMLWLLPTAAVTAYAAVSILMQAEGKIKRHLLLLAMLASIALSGTTVYNGTIFERKQNNYKLPQDTVNLCDMLNADAEANGISHKKLIAEHRLLSSIRQYDASILMPYGYDAVKKNKTANTNAYQIYQIMGSEKKNLYSLAWYAALEDCNYLALPASEEDAAVLSSLGYDIAGANESCYLYRRNPENTDYAGQWLITQYGSAEGSQLMFYTMQDKDGHLIVVDGGWVQDADYVRRIIKGLGNRVDAWIITHPHKDHAGAFTEIYKKPGKMKIDKVYAVDMAPPEVCLKKSPWDETEIYNEWLKLDIPQLSYVHAGDSFEAAGLAFQILNAYGSYVDEWSDDLLNDGSMMFKVTAKEESMLFCADVGKRMTDYLLDTYGDELKADYIQMGHHGNGGLKPRFYQSIGAKGAFFDAPDWLMNDTSGKYQTLKNVQLMKKAGAQVYSYSTTPNQVVLR